LDVSESLEVDQAVDFVAGGEFALYALLLFEDTVFYVSR
jgi:hypothetical protein